MATPTIPKIKLGEFVPERVVYGEVEEKTAKNNPSVKFFEFKIKYKYDTGTWNMHWELPPCKSIGGIVEKLWGNEDGGGSKSVKSICMFLDMEHSETPVFIEQWNYFYEQTCRYVLTNKAKIDKTLTLDFVKRPLKNPLYRATDDDGNPVEGKGFSMYIKLFQYENGGHSTFMLPDGSDDGMELSWDRIKDIQIIHNPIVDVTSIFWGGKSTFRMFLNTTIITSIEPYKKQNMNADLMKQLTSSQETIANLQEQLRLLTAAHKTGEFVPENKSETKEVTEVPLIPGSQDDPEEPSAEKSSVEIFLANAPTLPPAEVPPRPKLNLKIPGATVPSVPSVPQPKTQLSLPIKKL